MKRIYFNRVFWFLIVVSTIFVIGLPLLKVPVLLKELGYLSFTDVNHSMYRDLLKGLATLSLLIFLLFSVILGLILIIWLNQDKSWSRSVGVIGFTCLIMGAIGVFYADWFQQNNYYQISATMTNLEKGTVFVKIQFDSLDPTFKGMLEGAKEGKIHCFVRTHLEQNSSTLGFSEIKLNQDKSIRDKQNYALDSEFLDEFLKNPSLTLEFELSDKNILIYKDIGSLSKGTKIIGRRKDEILINKKSVQLPCGQLLIYFLFKDFNGNPIAVYL